MRNYFIMRLLPVLLCFFTGVAFADCTAFEPGTPEFVNCAYTEQMHQRAAQNAQARAELLQRERAMQYAQPQQPRYAPIYVPPIQFTPMPVAPLQAPQRLNCVHTNNSFGSTTNCY